MEVFGNQRLPEAAEVVRARLAALFQPAFPADGAPAEAPGEPWEPFESAASEHLHPDTPPPPRWRLTRRHVMVMAALSLIAVMGSMTWMLRAKAVPIAVAVGTDVPSTATVAPYSPGASSASPGPTASSVAPTIRVHVLGAVVAPGVVILHEGARVADALAAAGGLRSDADPAELNLAAVLADGSQVVIGTKAAPRGEVRAGAQAGGGAAVVPSAAATAALVNLNTATLEQLDALPGVGPVLAQAIIDYRTKHGKFSRIEELQEVDGIGAKTYAQIAPHVRI